MEQKMIDMVKEEYKGFTKEFNPKELTEHLTAFFKEEKLVMEIEELEEYRRLTLKVAGEDVIAYLSKFYLTSVFWYCISTVLTRVAMSKEEELHEQISNAGSIAGFLVNQMEITYNYLNSFGVFND